MITKEIWKPIKGYEGLYEVSNLGRIRSFVRYKSYPIPHLLKPAKTKNGYQVIRLHKDKRKCTKYVHRIVAETFIKNEHNLKCVNHKDEFKSNNSVENLEWCTYQYNNTYGSKIERAVKHTNYKEIAKKIDFKKLSRLASAKRERKIVQINKDGVLINVFNSIKDANKLGFSSSKIVLCCKGKSKTHKGYRWLYKEDYDAL